MSDLPQALKEAYARSTSSTRHLVALELVHNSFPGGAIYVVNYDSDIVVSGDIYVGLAMDITEPESGSEPGDKVSVRLDGVTSGIQFWINSAIQTATNIPVNMRPFAYNIKTNTVIGVMGTYPFLLLRAQYNDQAVVLDLGHVSPTNQPFPGIKYSPQNSPELYR
jgi:hypothetical protein